MYEPRTVQGFDESIAPRLRTSGKTKSRIHRPVAAESVRVTPVRVNPLDAGSVDIVANFEVRAAKKCAAELSDQVLSTTE